MLSRICWNDKSEESPYSWYDLVAVAEWFLLASPLSATLSRQAAGGYSNLYVRHLVTVTG